MTMGCGIRVPSSPPHPFSFHTHPQALSPTCSGQTHLQAACLHISHTFADFTSGKVEAQKGSDLAKVTKLVRGRAM